MRVDPKGARQEPPIEQQGREGPSAKSAYLLLKSNCVYVNMYAKSFIVSQFSYISLYITQKVTSTQCDLVGIQDCLIEILVVDILGRRSCFSAGW